VQVDLHGLHVEEALRVLERHLIALGGLGHPGGILLQVRRLPILYSLLCSPYRPHAAPHLCNGHRAARPANYWICYLLEAAQVAKARQRPVKEGVGL
jgi:hypothetical protein